MTAPSIQPSLPSPKSPRRTGFRRAAFLIPAALVIAGGTVALTLARAGEDASQEPAAASAPPAPRVTVASVEQRVITEFEEITGRVDAIENVELRSRVSGHIASLHFQSGQNVKAGDLLFSIDPRWYRAQANLAAAEVEQARARLSNAEREATRADDLLAQKAISVEESDARRAVHAEARAAVLASEARLATAKLDLEHTEVRSPIDGRVSRAFVTVGNLVSGAPGGATVLTRIVSTGAAYVYADIDELTVQRFNQLTREGRIQNQDGRIPVFLQTGAEDDFPHEGFVESVDNRLDPATGSLTVRMQFLNTDGSLMPGMFARVRVPISEPRPTLLISERAIGTDQSQKFVLAVTDSNTVAYRTVKVGPAIEGMRVVRDGLVPGERIVVNGLQRVRPGMTVEPEVASAAAPPVTATAEVAAR